MNWAVNGQTLLLVLSKGCRFCTESASFYERLERETEEQGGTRLVAVFPHSLDAVREYLNELGIQINEVRQASLGSLGVRDTPTLILVNNDGVVTDPWVGLLSPHKEAEVLNRLQAQ